ncbi:HD family phosphohydrolase [Aurantibacter sp.]|uniref:HD family phosphohydrolase n=1 Tax=Aurantibacter sp. TaxID=2807103 RepID=UPI0035C836BB
MSFTFNQFYKNQAKFYKIGLLIVSTIFIVFLFPKSGRFKYDFEKGKPWLSETYFAPFTFAIDKTTEEINKEKSDIKLNGILYFNIDTSIVTQSKFRLLNELNRNLPDTLLVSNKEAIINLSKKQFNTFYSIGVLGDNLKANDNSSILILDDKSEVKRGVFSQIYTQEELKNELNKFITNEDFLIPFKTPIITSFFNTIRPNLNYNKLLTDKVLNEQLGKISYSRGIVEKETLIISKGEVVEGEKYAILKSLESKYESQIWTNYNFYWIIFAYTLLVALALLMLLLFLKKYRLDIFENNTKVTFIFFNIIVVILLTTLVINYNAAYVYIVPIVVLPLILKAFFDARLGLFAHVITVLLLGSIVPNSYEYMFLQIIAGIVTILTVSELYKRVNLFISVGQITLVYILAYFAFYVIHEGNTDNLEFETFGLFILCGLATLFVQPLIYVYEKLFGLVSDVSLLELSDTNSKLLKQLSNEAPGTFHHSLNVANLAEACANEIGANAMLVRVGALYHDIGKMNNPVYFTENQSSGLNPHDELSPIESAEIIIKHTLKGIEIAKKNKLPERIIDFIRTHHGTSVVYFFYKKALEIDENILIKDFQYSGPIPFNKETAILMMCDSVEAASKSLKEPTTPKIDYFVESIIEKQMTNGQFLNSNITFKNNTGPKED